MRMTRSLVAATLHLATVCFIAMFGICIVNIVMRVFWGTSLGWSEEVSRYLIPWVTYLGAAVLAGSGLHMTIADWNGAFGWQRTLLRTIGDVVTFVTLGYVAYIGGQFATQMAGRSLITLPDISMFTVYASLPLGCVLYMLFIVLSRLGLFPSEMGQMYVETDDEENAL